MSERADKRRRGRELAPPRASLSQQLAVHMKPPHRKLLRRCEWRLTKLFGSAADQVHEKGEEYIVRIAARTVRKRMPVEDADTIHAYIQLASSSVPRVPCHCDALDELIL